jgi:periplasmic protein TonB
VTPARAEKAGLQQQWMPAMWGSLCLHMIIIGALQPAPAPTENRFSERAIEVTIERAAAPPAPPAAAMTMAVDSALAPGASDDEKPTQATAAENETPKLEQAVMLSQPAPAVDSRELALAALATAPRPAEQVPHQPPQQKAIKPPASAPSAAANQQQALQDYVLQVVRKLSQSRFYAASSSAQNGHGVVIARLTVARDGGLIDLSLPKQSGSAGVDGSLLDAIRRAAPFAPLPKGFTDSRFTFIVPINYTPEQ